MFCQKSRLSCGSDRHAEMMRLSSFSLSVYTTVVFHAIHKADRVNSNFPIVEPIVHLLDRRSVENPPRVFEVDAMPLDIAPVLALIPTIPHDCIYAM